MKQQAAVLKIESTLILAFTAAVMAFLFSFHANAASHRTSVVVKTPAKKLAVKKAKSVMFIKLGQRKLLAQNSSAKAIDARLEGEVAQDSIPVAAPLNNKLSATVKAPEAQKGIKASGLLIISTGQNINTAANKSYSGTYTLRPAVSHAETNLSLSGELEYSREYTYELKDGTDGDWSNPLLKLRKKQKTSGLIDSFTYGPTLTVGMGNESRRQTFKGSLGASLGAEKKLSALTIAPSVGYAYRLYEFDIRKDGTVNSPNSFSASTDLTYAFNDWVSFSTSFALQHIISFQNVGRTFSTTAFSLDFQVQEHASISVGAATIKRGTLEPSGQSNKITLWDADTAVASIELGLSF